MKRYISLKEQENFEKMRQYFIDRTNKHIDLVKKYSNKILDSDFNSFINVSDFIDETECHDYLKFQEPELTPYIRLTWQHKLDNYNSYKKPGIINDKEINAATLDHIKRSSHHPEFWTDQTKNILNTEDKDKAPEEIVDATKMPLTYVACMVADWCAMAEELKNSPIDWADNNINVRWKFTDEQRNFIYKLLKEIWQND